MQATLRLPASSVSPVSIGCAIGWLLVGAALVAFGQEIWLAWRSGSYGMVALGTLWYQIDAGSLNLAQAVIQRHVHPLLWDPLLVGALRWPAWSLLGGPGAALVLAFQRQRGG